VMFRSCSSQCTTISFCQCWFSPTVSGVVFSWSVYADITLETVALDTLKMWQFCHSCSSWTRTNYLCSFKIGEVSYFPLLSYGLSPNTITNVLTRALQSVNKRKNIQRCQLKFFQFIQHIFYSSVSQCFHCFVHPLYM
jgi:hypothetical protein